jgi:hypothetical protein
MISGVTVGDVGLGGLVNPQTHTIGEGLEDL